MDNIGTSLFTGSPDTEVDRLLFTARSIVRGFYIEKGFVVESEISKVSNPASVIFPDLDYMGISNFWHNVGNIKRQIPISGSNKLKAQLSKLLGDHSVNPKKVSKLESEWKKTEPEFFQALFDLIPHSKKLFGNMEVRITNFGTISSHKILSTKRNQQAIYYLRSDADISHLAEIVVTSILQAQSTGFQTWEETEAITDFVMQTPQISSLFPRYKPTTNSLKNVRLSDIKKSEKYVGSLGVKYQEASIQVNGLTIEINGKNANHKFSKRERAILLELIKNESIVPFDRVARILWEDPDDFSLWAMNKAVQRLRIKLIKLGINEDCLKTVRKQGYYLETGIDP